VELKLLSEVSSRQHVFFTVLSSYKQLRQQVAASCDQIEQLRTKMRSLEAKLRLMHAAWATQPTIQQLLAARDFAGALDLISSSQRLLATELSGICALKKLGDRCPSAVHHADL
jgi:vacuolar protein sorting-associated protein 54